jgi:biopolymer transport protein ExbD
VAITADDRIFFDGQEIRLDQVAPLVKQASLSSDQALIIQADKRTSHGMFAQVYTEGKKAGIMNVRFATARSDPP